MRCQKLKMENSKVNDVVKIFVICYNIFGKIRTDK